MPIEETEKIWMDGELVPWDEAKVHVLTHTLHYGSGVFEGIRAYPTSRGPAVFRLTEHMSRLHDSATLLHMDIPYSVEELVAATKETIRANKVESCYIRPLAYLGYGEMGLNPLPCQVNVSIAVWPWGTYLGDEGITQGRPHEDLDLATHGPEHQPGRGQGHRHLHQLEPGQGRGAARRLRRGDPAQHRRAPSPRRPARTSSR